MTIILTVENFMCDRFIIVRIYNFNFHKYQYFLDRLFKDEKRDKCIEVFVKE